MCSEAGSIKNRVEANLFNTLLPEMSFSVNRATGARHNLLKQVF
jgi:hypothetical protein